jgi:hypothetical protein
MILSDDRTDDRSLLTEPLAIEFLPILPAESTGLSAGRKATSKTRNYNIVERGVSMICAGCGQISRFGPLFWGVKE